MIRLDWDFQKRVYERTTLIFLQILYSSPMGGDGHTVFSAPLELLGGNGGSGGSVGSGVRVRACA